MEAALDLLSFDDVNKLSNSEKKKFFFCCAYDWKV